MNRTMVTRDYIREKLNIGEKQISEALKDVKPISDDGQVYDAERAWVMLHVYCMKERERICEEANAQIRANSRDIWRAAFEAEKANRMNSVGEYRQGEDEHSAGDRRKD